VKIPRRHTHVRCPRRFYGSKCVQRLYQMQRNECGANAERWRIPGCQYRALFRPMTSRSGGARQGTSPYRNTQPRCIPCSAVTPRRSSINGCSSSECRRVSVYHRGVGVQRPIRCRSTFANKMQRENIFFVGHATWQLSSLSSERVTLNLLLLLQYWENKTIKKKEKRDCFQNFVT